MTEQQRSNVTVTADDGHEYPWFRLYHDILGDKKLSAVKVAMGYTSTTTVLGVWVALLCLAAKEPEPGVLMIADGVPYQEEELAEAMNWPPSEITAILGQFRRLDMIYIRPEDQAICITHWEQRQWVKSDQSRMRVAKYRARLKDQENETLRNGYSNGQVTPPEYRLQNTDNRLQNIKDSNTRGEPEKNMSVSLSDSLSENQLLYQQNIGNMTDQEKVRLNKAEKEYGPEKVNQAIQVTVFNNKKSMAYLETVLANQRDGTPYRKRRDPWNERAGETDQAQAIPEVQRPRRRK